MLLSALAFATALQAAPLAEIPAAPSIQSSQPPSAKAPRAKRIQASGKGAAWCGGDGFERVAKVRPAGLHRLGDLPMANHTLTVLRLENGCPVSSTVRFNVGR